MRFATTIQTCLALLLAFFVSPFQHVHPGSDHDHTATIHAHFYSLVPHVEHGSGVTLEDADDDDHDAVWAVDSFTLVPAAVLTIAAPTSAMVELCDPTLPIARVDVVEERGHDPPQDCAPRIPRAPPS
ncbi:MAG: hypothetical protein JOZ32_06600 [Bryobacterales bacterium]|nr:hypothetical protein [Bryobacterales bacterium]